MELNLPLDGISAETHQIMFIRRSCSGHTEARRSVECAIRRIGQELIQCIEYPRTHLTVFLSVHLLQAKNVRMEAQDLWPQHAETLIQWRPTSAIDVEIF